jgi:hypothetical protein
MPAAVTELLATATYGRAGEVHAIGRSGSCPTSASAINPPLPSPLREVGGPKNLSPLSPLRARTVLSPLSSRRGEGPGLRRAQSSRVRGFQLQHPLQNRSPVPSTRRVANNPFPVPSTRRGGLGRGGSLARPLTTAFCEFSPTISGKPSRARRIACHPEQSEGSRSE